MARKSRIQTLAEKMTEMEKVAQMLCGAGYSKDWQRLSHKVEGMTEALAILGYDVDHDDSENVIIRRSAAKGG